MTLPLLLTIDDNQKVVSIELGVISLSKRFNAFHLSSIANSVHPLRGKLLYSSNCRFDVSPTPSFFKFLIITICVVEYCKTHKLPHLLWLEIIRQFKMLIGLKSCSCPS